VREGEVHEIWSKLIHFTCLFRIGRAAPVGLAHLDSRFLAVAHHRITNVISNVSVGLSGAVTGATVTK
jgi:hypothetical protein